jgi:hypothetical protein
MKNNINIENFLFEKTGTIKWEIQKNKVYDVNNVPKPNPPKDHIELVGSQKEGPSIKIEEYSKLNNEINLDENYLENNNLETLKISPELLLLPIKVPPFGVFGVTVELVAYCTPFK